MVCQVVSTSWYVRLCLVIVWYTMLYHGIIWHGLVRHGMVRHVTVRNGIYGMYVCNVLYGMVSYGVAWHGTDGTVQYGTVLYVYMHVMHYDVLMMCLV